MDEPFELVALNTRAAALCDAHMLVFANDDMVMLTEAWDRQLRGLLERAEIGVVGAHSIYPDETVQHAGILLGGRISPSMTGVTSRYPIPVPVRDGT